MHVLAAALKNQDFLETADLSKIQPSGVDCDSPEFGEI